MDVSVSMLLLWAAVGICPDWIPRRLPLPRPPRTWPWPPPPWWPVVGIIGGLAGGFIYDRVFGPASADAASIYPAATSVGALVGSVILQRIVGAFVGPGREAAQDERVG